MARSPFSLARLIRITETGKVVYRGEKTQCQRSPEVASADWFGGISRNFQLFDPLDLLAELTQHIPNKSEHLIRYYGWYSNKSRGLRAIAVVTGTGPVAPSPAAAAPPISKPARRRWVALIKRVYQTDPRCYPRCGGQMRIISFIEAHQRQVIERIRDQSGLWSESPARPVAADRGPGPPRPRCAVRSGPRR